MILQKKGPHLAILKSVYSADEKLCPTRFQRYNFLRLTIDFTGHDSAILHLKYII